MGAELFHADGSGGMKMLIVAFRYFVNAPKNLIFNHNEPPISWFFLYAQDIFKEEVTYRSLSCMT